MKAAETGNKCTTDPRIPLARVHGMLMEALGDDGPKVVGWMPAHLKLEEVGVARKSDGSVVTKTVVVANGLADRFAKEGVEFHRVPRGVVQDWKVQAAKAERRAKWLGNVTFAASNFQESPSPGFRSLQVES